MEHPFIAVFGVITVSSNNLFGILQIRCWGFLDVAGKMTEN